MTRQCESLTSGGTSCPLRASWLVRVGARRTDEQAACRRHLSQTCLAMAGAEGERQVTLTVTSLVSRWEAARERE